MYVYFTVMTFWEKFWYMVRKSFMSFETQDFEPHRLPEKQHAEIYDYTIKLVKREKK